MFLIQWLVKSADMKPLSTKRRLRIISTILDFGDEIHKTFPSVMKHSTLLEGHVKLYTYSVVEWIL